MWTMASLPLLSVILWPGVVVPVSPIYGSNRIVQTFAKGLLLVAWNHLIVC